jgi:hypothetical protein
MPPMTAQFRLDIHSRQIADSDVEATAKLLGKGLGYSTQVFLRIFDRLKQHPTPDGFPKYGYLLEVGGSIVGAILLIFSTIRSSGAPMVRCHVTSWYVEPAYRCYGALFYLKPLNLKNVTYMNVSARASALPFLKIQGFQKYSNGQFVAFPMLKWARGERVQLVSGDTVPAVPFETFERDLLLTHARYGCLTLWCLTPERAYPFVFQSRLYKGIFPGVQLIYCRDVADVVRFARPIGSFLAARGKFVLRIDANGPIAGLPGIYFEGMEPRFYKGTKPRLGDLAYTQTAMVPHVRKGN